MTAVRTVLGDVTPGDLRVCDADDHLFMYHATDWRLTDSLVALTEAGHAERLLLGGDTTTAEARGAPAMPYLLRRLRPELARRLGDGFVTTLLVADSARAFAADWR